MNAAPVERMEDVSLATSGPPAPPEEVGVRNPRRVRARGVALRIDPVFADVLPEPSAARMATLRAGLLAHGGTTAFVLLWAGTETIIDGMHRYPLCQEHDLWMWLGEIELADRAAVVEWIRQRQWGQRDLGLVGASCIRGETYNARKGTRGGDHKSGRSNGNDFRLIDVAQEVGALYGLTPRTIRNDGQLADCVRRIADNCGPEARRALLSGDHRVSRNEILRLARENAVKQREAICFLIEHQRMPPVEGERSTVTLPRRNEKMVPALLRLMGVREAEEFHQRFGLALEQVKGGPGAMVSERA